MPERLRVWQMAGVRHFYIDPDAALAAGPSAAETPAGEETAQALIPPHNEAAASIATAPRADRQPQPGPAPDVPLDPPLPADPALWPDPWPALFAKAPARPRLVITYADLGYDLTGQADPRRGGLWRTLLRDLDLAGKNAVAFWPFALPMHTILTDSPRHFAAGISRLAPSVLAVFGPLPPAVAAALGQTGQPMPVIEQFPHPGILLASDPEAWNHVCTTLSRYF
ncbi:hypothetical protein DVDV_3588 [Desulfovibrio sp. DV]|nr:hypothetical protein DVDV_3588 [Desulfovibrio sp. DV]